jgi:hypothetical protein
MMEKTVGEIKGGRLSRRGIGTVIVRQHGQQKKVPVVSTGTSSLIRPNGWQPAASVVGRVGTVEQSSALDQERLPNPHHQSELAMRLGGRDRMSPVLVHRACRA